VTSGRNYCGVIGHTLRREFTVLSMTINKAARLMIHYPNIVSCDQNTLIQSKMNLKHFQELPERYLKGIRSKKPNYEFREIEDFDKLSVTGKDAVCVFGRDELLQSINEALSGAIQIFNNYRNATESRQKFCFAIRGGSQEGKSTIINKLFRDYRENNLRCLRLILNTKHLSMQFWVIKYVVGKIFGSENYEDLITKKLSKFKVEKLLFVLNEIFDTKFEQPTTRVMSLEKQRALQQLLVTVLFKQLSHFWIVLIDDADFIDSESMHFLNAIIESQTVYFILTIGKQHKKWTLRQKNFYRDVTPHCLRPIDKTFHKDIACQSIKVSAIPIEFERFLQTKSNGNAGWIETCTKTLIYSGKLKIKTLTIMEAIIEGLILKNDLLTHDGKCDGEFFDIIHSTSARLCNDSRGYDQIDAAVLEHGLQDNDYVVQTSNSKLMLYDSLSSHDQAVCKCASVLGSEFERALLTYLMPNTNLRAIGKTITKLFQLNILYCASTKQHDEAMWAIKNEVISCNCSNLEIFESCVDLPKYASCANLTFHDEKFRKHIYDTLPEKQLKEYHKKCIIYLYRNNKKCSQCGNESFDVIDEIKLNYRDGYVKFRSGADRGKKKMLKELKVKFRNFDHKSCDKRRKMYPLVLNYLNYNFRSCKCDEILPELVRQIISHCQGKDTLKKKIFSQLTLAELCLKSSNVPHAKSLLNTAAESLQVGTSL
jgi:adenylate cyclase 10